MVMMMMMILGRVGDGGGTVLGRTVKRLTISWAWSVEGKGRATFIMTIREEEEGGDGHGHGFG